MWVCKNKNYLVKIRIEDMLIEYKYGEFVLKIIIIFFYGFIVVLEFEC